MSYPGSAEPARLVYLLADVSGSTVRAGFNAGWHRALPELVSVLEAASVPYRLCVMSYQTDARMDVPLTRVEDLAVLPAMPPGGLSSLAAGLGLLARTVAEDHDQLAADRVPVHDTAALVFADGLPTDPGERVLSARAALGSAARPEVRLHVAFPGDADPLAVAGLGATAHVLSVGHPAQVSGSIVSVARAALDGSA